MRIWKEKTAQLFGWFSGSSSWQALDSCIIRKKRGIAIVDYNMNNWEKKMLNPNLYNRHTLEKYLKIIL